MGKQMGYYAGYHALLRKDGPGALEEERKSQLKRISTLRSSNVLVIASDMSGISDKSRAPIAIDYTDRMAVKDQLESMSASNKHLDVILETPGGSAEITEDIVSMIRNRFPEKVSFIIPGHAKSAGTIMVMSGDEILMSSDSALGPIDAQIFVNGKMISAEACITGLLKIMSEVKETNKLNSAYIPILQGISPGEIQSWQNAQDFSYRLVSEWLCKWKFRYWTTHSSNGQPVSEEDKLARAQQIADELRNHSKWLTHGRSIRLSQLKEIGLQITDYSSMNDLNDAISRYYTLLRMLFEISEAYKIFETPDTQIVRFLSAPQPLKIEQQNVESFDVKVNCMNCRNEIYVQANFLPNIPIKNGRLPFPKNNKLICGKCRSINDVSKIRAEIEIKTGKQIV